VPRVFAAVGQHVGSSGLVWAAGRAVNCAVDLAVPTVDFVAGMRLVPAMVQLCRSGDGRAVPRVFAAVGQHVGSSGLVWAAGRAVGCAVDLAV
jgi:uncharacterized protein YycO